MRNLPIIITLIFFSLPFASCNRSGNNESSNAASTSADNQLQFSTVIIDDMPPGRGLDSTQLDTNTYLFAISGQNDLLPDNEKVILINGKDNISGTISKDEQNNYSIIGEDGVSYSLGFSKGIDTLKTSQMKLYFTLPVVINNESSHILIPETQLQRLLKKE